MAREPSPSTPARDRPLHRITVGDEQRTVPERFFGFNGASIVQPVNVELLLDERLQQQLARFPVGLIRVPSGTAAQWLDWHSGRFIDHPASPFAAVPGERRGITLADWRELLERTGAQPVWDLNVLNATLEDQLAMLHRARSLGLPVHYVELGNELWDPRSIYPTRFPSGQAYASQMGDWIRALRREFPDVRIALSGADPADEIFSSTLGPRFNDWNQQVSTQLEGADALAIHPYWILPGGQPPGSDIAATLTAGLDHWQRFRAVALAALPPNVEVWLTEWNKAGHFASSGTQIWAQALSVVAVGLEQLLEPRVTISLVHNIVDGTGNPHDIGVATVFPSFANGSGGSTELGRTALGHALPQLFTAIGPGATVRRLTIAGVPAIGGHDGVRGILIGGRRPGALLVNLTAESVSVEVPPELGSRPSFRMVAAAPAAQPGWVATDRVDTTEGRVHGRLELTPYSVTRISRG